MGTKHRSREHWFALVVEYEGSGLSQRAFAQKRGVNAHTFSNWVQRRRNELKATGEGQHARSSVDFVEVVPVTRESATAGRAQSCQLVLGAVALELAELPPPAWLVEVAAVARSR